ncbi:hypothetical protein GGI11_005793 [Coemansia sp. RSA 2049]|nr:hypothetical protein GGI11_005793 [Coemansia sp. RSA 2049]KAJ2517598.1 hypothetical protein H4217_003857 [Coemansia sp. RSA 1939]
MEQLQSQPQPISSEALSQAVTDNSPTGEFNGAVEDTTQADIQAESDAAVIFGADQHIASKTETETLAPSTPTAYNPLVAAPLPAPSRSLNSQKSLVMSATPRVPSNLRMVIAPEPQDSDNDGLEREYGNGMYDRNGETSGAWLEKSYRRRTSLDPHQALLQDKRLSHSPMLRREWSEPTLAALSKRPASSIKCLPYPHTLDSYIQKQRPHSINTLSNASCRLSIVTVDQEYKEYSYKKQADITVRPSMLRGWVRRFGGKIMYSFGQAIASPTLILKGNHEVTHGTIQMNMSRHGAVRNKERVQNKSSNRLLRKKMTSLKVRKDALNKRGIPIVSQKRSINNDSDSTYEPAAILVKDSTTYSTTELSVSHTVDIMEIAAAAEVVANMEIAAMASSMLATRLSDNINAVEAESSYGSPYVATENIAGITSDISQSEDLNSPLSGSTRSNSTDVNAKDMSATDRNTSRGEITSI